MTTANKTKKVYKSFEQFKAELFPILTKVEKEKKNRLDLRNFGVNLANNALDEILVKEK